MDFYNLDTVKQMQLLTGVDALETTFQVYPGEGAAYIAAPCIAVISPSRELADLTEAEHVIITNITNDTLTVTRGAFNAAVAHNAGVYLLGFWSPLHLTQIQDLFTSLELDNANLFLQNALPTLKMSETDQGVDAKNWWFNITSGTFAFQILSDVWGSAVDIFTATRSAITSITNIVLKATNITLKGNVYVNTAANPSILLQEDASNNLLHLYDDGAGAGFIRRRSASGSAALFIDSLVDDFTSQADIRILRNTQTTGNRYILIYKGDASSTVQFQFDAANADFLANRHIRTTLGQFIQGTGNAPVAWNSVGTTGMFAWDANYFYVCVGTNTWKRMALDLTSW